MPQLEKFHFTNNIYTGSKSSTITPINELILGIACALESPEHYKGSIYAYNRDEEKENNSLEFHLDTSYINELRHSPEYHDAVFTFLIKSPAYIGYQHPQYRMENFGKWCDLMSEYGVLGTVSLYPNKTRPSHSKTHPQ